MSFCRRIESSRLRLKFSRYKVTESGSEIIFSSLEVIPTKFRFFNFSIAEEN